MWPEVFESNQGDLPEDPSCLAGLASLEVLAVPRERESEFSQCCILTYTTQISSYHTLTSNHQVIKTPSCVRQTGCTVAAWYKKVISSQGDESSALSTRKLWACVAGNHRNTRNNRSFPAPLNAPVWLYQARARSFSFNQKRGKGEVRKNRAPAVAAVNRSYL